jgi:hypothetical protein
VGGLVPGCTFPVVQYTLIARELMLYQVLDWFFMIFHPVIILFNVLGWIHPKTRKANLILLLLTGFSWGFLGIWMGFGYCPLSDWHFGVLRNLGVTDLPHSYITYLLERITGVRADESLIDILTAVIFSVALLASVYINGKDKWRDKCRKR